jgi:two-component system sensor kinase FixL
MRIPLTRWILPIAFVIGYVALDRFSYIEPLFGLNITPWNPSPALGMIYWLRRGKAAAPLWFFALVISEWLTRGLPEGWLLTFGLSLWLMVGYGAIGEAMRRARPSLDIFDDRQSLFVWLCVVFIGTFFNSIGYLTLLHLSGLIPPNAWLKAFTSFWVGDLVGLSVSMPIFWILSSADGRTRIRDLLLKWETAGYAALAIGMLLLVFEPRLANNSTHFYFLFLPVVWAAGRQGLGGAIVAATLLQVGVIIGVEWQWHRTDIHSVVEFQLLDAALALVGFFLGVVVDEQRKAENDLKRSLRLAAAGDMATALAHELNQPITALSAYGKTCQYLLEMGETGKGEIGKDEIGELLKDTIRRMIEESTRAADVVRRLRDFFRTGALQLESVEMDALVAEVTLPMRERFEEHGVQLITNVEAGAKAFIDRVQIGLVLRNLLGNAFEAVTSEPIKMPAVKLTATVLAGSRLRCSIEDNGPGISAEIAARLFEPFVSSKSSGLGLGLIISKAIVETHGGTLWTETSPNGIFRFELPLSERLDHARGKS